MASLSSTQHVGQQKFEAALTPIEHIALTHSWPVWERSRHFELGQILNSAVTDAIVPTNVGELGVHHVGCWECDLTDNSLIWSGGVYDIFGLPRGAPIRRAEAVALYREESRAAMERLRAYAIRHNRGFTMDAEIRTGAGQKRLMRLIAAPVFVDGRAVRLHGIKLIV